MAHLLVLVDDLTLRIQGHILLLFWTWMDVVLALFVGLLLNWMLFSIIFRHCCAVMNHPTKLLAFFLLDEVHVRVALLQVHFVHLGLQVWHGEVLPGCVWITAKLHTWVVEPYYSLVFLGIFRTPNRLLVAIVLISTLRIFVCRKDALCWFKIIIILFIIVLSIVIGFWELAALLYQEEVSTEVVFLWILLWHGHCCGDWMTFLRHGINVLFQITLKKLHM